MSNGLELRASGETSANATSSRSHALLSIILKDRNNENNIYSKLAFIDLAGSERGSDVIDNSKEIKKDGASINLSLLALKECIRAIDDERNHKPFRGSKMTLILREYFVGKNCFTLMIAQISPKRENTEDTLNTLKQAQQVKSFTSKAKNNKQDMKNKINNNKIYNSSSKSPRQIIMKSPSRIPNDEIPNITNNNSYFNNRYINNQKDNIDRPISANIINNNIKFNDLNRSNTTNLYKEQCNTSNKINNNKLLKSNMFVNGHYLVNNDYNNNINQL